MRRTTSIVIVLISVLALIPSRGQATDTSAVDTIKQLEQEMGDAMIAGDVDKLNQIYADDFATDGSSGKVITKQHGVANSKVGVLLHPNTTAVCTGSVACYVTCTYGCVAAVCYKYAGAVGCKVVGNGAVVHIK